MILIKYWLELLIGKWNSAWGFCPECNSSAPEMDHCDVCKGCRGTPAKKDKVELWRNIWRAKLKARYSKEKEQHEVDRALEKTNRQLEKIKKRDHYRNT